MRASPRSWTLLGSALMLALCAGCDQDHPPGMDPGGPPRPPGVGGGGTGGGTGDGDGFDATLASCDLDPVTIAGDAAVVDDTGVGALDFGVAGGEDDFVVAFADQRTAVERIFSRRIDETGVLEAEQAVSLDAALARDPTVLATDSGFLVAFAEQTTLDDAFDVRARALGPTGLPIGTTPTNVSELTGLTADDFAPSLVAAGAPGESLLAFSTVDFGVTQARIVPIDDDAVLAGPDQPVSDAFGVAGPLDLASLGIGPTGVASFIDVEGALQLVRLTDDGATNDVPIPIRAGDDFTGVFDVAAGTAGGVAVVGFDRATTAEEVDPALAVRVFDADGDLADIETPLFTDADVQGGSPSAVALDEGFAVAFRRASPVGTTIRLVVLDADGDVVGQRDIADVGSTTGGLRLARAADGTLLVVFDEPLGAGRAALEAVRVVCE